MTFTDTPTFPGLFKKDRNTDADFMRLSNYLERRGWRTAKEIESVLGFADRYTRILAAESKGQIIGSSTGYKLTRETTPEEMNEYRGRQQAQIRATADRLSMTERVWHSREVAA